MTVDTSTAQIEQVITEALTSFGAEPADINPDATFESLSIDSLDLAELSQILEEKFAVTLTSGDVADIKTVGDAVNFVSARVQT